MAAPLALVWDLIAKDSASGVFRKVGAEAKVAAKETATMNESMAKAGTLIAAAGIGIAAVSTKMAIDFQESTTKLVTGAGESEDAIESVRKGILDMAGSVGTMPEELSKGMFLIESAGFHGAKGLDVLHAAAEGAKVGGAEMATVADGLTTAMKDYAIPTGRAADVTSKLVATVAAGKTNMNDLSSSLAKVLPFSANLGISLHETMGAMATMTGEGIAASNAATMLKFTMMSLSNETPKGAKALLDVGLSASKVNSDLGDKGLHATLTEITDAIGKRFPKGSADYNKALASIVGGTRGMGAALALGGKHADEFAKNTEAVGKASADADGHVKNFSTTQKDIAFQVDQAKAALSAFGIELGNEILPVVTSAIKFFTEHETITKDLGIAVLAVAGFLVTYSAATKVATAATGTYAAVQKLLGVNMAATAAATEGATAAQAELDVAMDANPIGAVAAGVGLLAGAFLAFKGHANQASAAEKKFDGSLSGVTDTLTKQTGALTSATRATEAKALADAGAFTTANKVGVSYKTVLAAALGNASAQDTLSAAVLRYSQAQDFGTTSGRKAIAGAVALVRETNSSSTAIDKQRTTINQTAEALGKAGKIHAKPTLTVAGLDGTLVKVHNLLGLLSGLDNSKISNKSVPGMYDPSGGKAYAKGTNYAPGGLSWVGENGPELINLKRGTQVIPHDVSMEMARHGGSHGGTSRAAEKFYRAAANGGLAITVDGKPARLSIQGA